MTPEQITVPKQTWDALIAALNNWLELDSSDIDRKLLLLDTKSALAAANAVSGEPELVAIEGMPQGLGNEPEILAQWDEVKAASEGEFGKRQWHSVGAWLYEGDAIAVISDAVSHQKPETTPAPEGGAITFESDHFLGVRKMVQPLGWYCVSRDGLATQCADRDDALQCAKLGALDWPNSAPYRAVQLCEYTHPQASEPTVKDSLTVPAGWKLVPVEPDETMLSCGDMNLSCGAADVYLAMLAAAPEAK